MKNIFDAIYLNKYWVDPQRGSESGPGSSFECSSEYLLFLQKFIHDYDIKSIIDLGCGDFNLMKHFNLQNVSYKGVDIVYHIIEQNKSKYTTPTVSFEYNDISECVYKNYDLLIIKDVIQHLDNSTIYKILKNITENKYILIINDYTTINTDCLIGGYRPINVAISPFNLPGNWIFEWDSCGFFKKCYLIKNNILLNNT